MLRALMPSMRRPSAEQLAALRPFERFAFEIADTVNRRRGFKRVAHRFLETVGAGWVHLCTHRLLRVEGLEHLQGLDPDRGVVIVANHRSFFDLYVIASVMLRETQWIDGMYFPVRGEYFYERPDGIAVNALMSAWAMYPPILRRPEARLFNEYTVDLMAELLSRRGTVVGMHPEGTRGKGPDPYTLLPAQPGIGQMVHRARPIVLPVFILGLGNDLKRQVLGNFDGTGDPVTLQFGPPVALDRLFAAPARLRTYKQIADHLREVLVELGARDRAFRARHGLPHVGAADLDRGAA
jgi:1-acyl-sn-glycerol-3-phosphate acyltransferase